MRPLVRLERRCGRWLVLMRSNRVAYSDPCYAKAVGVFDYLEQRRKESERETKRQRQLLAASLSIKATD